MPVQPNSGPIDRACQTCGIVFRARTRFGGHERFCSKDCVDAAKQRTATLVCQHCGTLFHVRASIAKPGRRFCTRACKTAYNRTLPVVWQRVMRRARRVGQCLHHGYRVAPEHSGHVSTFIGGYGDILVHRFVFMYANGLSLAQLEEVPVVRHTCNHGWCIEPRHLIPGTHHDNAQDRVESYRRDGEPMSRGR